MKPFAASLLLCAAFGALIATVPAAQSHDDHAHAEDDHSHHEGKLDGVRTVHAWVRAGNEDEKLLFVEIENNSDRDIMIIGGESEAAESVELVGFQLQDGQTVYQPLEGVPIKAGTEMVLAPNGLALRLNGMREEMIEGEEHTIDIEFDIGHIDMHFQVEPANATQHSHAGHNH